MTKSVACAVLLAAVLGVACGDDDTGGYTPAPDERPEQLQAPPIGVLVPIEVIEREVNGEPYVCFSREWVAFQGSDNAHVISDLSCVKG